MGNSKTSLNNKGKECTLPLFRKNFHVQQNIIVVE